MPWPGDGGRVGGLGRLRWGKFGVAWICIYIYMIYVYVFFLGGGSTSPFGQLKRFWGGNEPLVGLVSTSYKGLNNCEHSGTERPSLLHAQLAERVSPHCAAFPFGG